jgi:response regulator of citrate/malate metabolism
VKNEDRQAPDLIIDLLQIPSPSFTIEDVEEFLGISRLRARAVLTYGLQQEQIRTALDHKDESRRLSIYDKSSWHRKWITKKW